MDRSGKNLPPWFHILHLLSPQCGFITLCGLFCHAKLVSANHRLELLLLNISHCRSRITTTKDQDNLRWYSLGSVTYSGGGLLLSANAIQSDTAAWNDTAFFQFAPRGSQVSGFREVHHQTRILFGIKRKLGYSTFRGLGNNRGENKQTERVELRGEGEVKERGMNMILSEKDERER